MIKTRMMALPILIGCMLVASGQLSVLADSDATRVESSSPAQSTVALKGDFPSVDRTSALVKSALSAKYLKAAQATEGEQATFTGKVAKVYIPTSNSIVVLDFAQDYDTPLTAVVKPEAYKAFPDLAKLVGKTVVITGPVTEFRDRPQVVLTTLNQIKVVKG